MSTLPELTNEQVDEAYRITYGIPHDEPVVRNIHWRVLRGAFPAPKPPAPRWEATGVSHDDHPLRVEWDSETPNLIVVGRGRGEMLVECDDARSMAIALHGLVDWIEANR